MTFRRKLVSTSIFTFKNAGDQLTATLVKKGSQVIQGRDTTRYVLENASGRYAINGSVQLDDAMDATQEGDIVEIIYKGEEESGSGMQVKQFEIYILQIEEAASEE